MDKSVKFWDRMAEKYSKQPIADLETYQKKLEMTRKYLNSDTTVLEFGCGTGSTALVHAPRAKSVVAIDSSEKMVEIAREKAKEAGVANVEFLASTLAELSCEKESFDVLLGLNILHLVDDMDGEIKRCWNLLKPGGVFVTSTACIGETAKFLKYILPIGAKLGLTPLVKVFDVATFESSVTSVGFKTIETMIAEKDKANCFMIFRK